MYITKKELERDFDIFPNYVVSNEYKNIVRVVKKIILHRETQLNVDEIKAQIRQGDDLKARTIELKLEFETEPLVTAREPVLPVTLQLEATLESYLDINKLQDMVPTVRLLELSNEEINTDFPIFFVYNKLCLSACCPL